MELSIFSQNVSGTPFTEKVVILTTPDSVYNTDYKYHYSKLHLICILNKYPFIQDKSDVIKQNELELTDIDLEIQPIIAFKFLCIFVLRISLK